MCSKLSDIAAVAQGSSWRVMLKTLCIVVAISRNTIGAAGMTSMFGAMCKRTRTVDCSIAYASATAFLRRHGKARRVRTCAVVAIGRDGGDHVAVLDGKGRKVVTERNEKLAIEMVRRSFRFNIKFVRLEGVFWIAKTVHVRRNAFVTVGLHWRFQSCRKHRIGVVSMTRNVVWVGLVVTECNNEDGNVTYVGNGV